MLAAEILLRAADRIENVGWCREVAVRWDENLQPTAFCAVGAITYEGVQGLRASFQHPTDPQVALALQTLCDVMGMSPVLYNDMAATTPADVSSMLREAAFKLRYPDLPPLTMQTLPEYIESLVPSR